MFRVLFVFMCMTMPSMARAVTCDTTQYINGDACTECPVNATCDGVNYTCLDGFRDNGGLCAVCPAGQYLLNGECLECPAVAYCIGDDTLKSCFDLWTDAGKPLPQEYLDAGGTNAVNRIYLEQSSVYSRITDKTDPDTCICGFFENLYNNSQSRKDVHAPRRLWEGKCSVGPTKYIGIQYTACDDGYYGRIRDEEKRSQLYEECAPCDNAPADSTYTDYGTPDATGTRERSNCPWTCNDGYFMEFTENTDGTVEPNEENSVCRKLCSAGFRTLNIKTADKHITVRLYDEKKTSPSLHIGRSADNVCHADLLPDDLDNPQTGTLKIAYNGTVYYASSPLRTMDCTRANYYLTDGGSCGACGGKHYCPAGTNERISCATTFVDQTAQGIPLPTIYSRNGNASGSTPESCQCQWDNLSNPSIGIEKYFVINYCYMGLRADVASYRYISYQDCSIGYYASGNRNGNNSYMSCLKCTNGPANSYYTSYSTPSIMGAVESNCPWECNDGYVRDGNTCVAE